VEKFDPERLRVSVWQGRVDLQDLVIRLEGHTEPPPARDGGRDRKRERERERERGRVLSGLKDGSAVCWKY